jgi:hypothetical protein
MPIECEVDERMVGQWWFVDDCSMRTWYAFFAASCSQRVTYPGTSSAKKSTDKSMRFERVESKGHSFPFMNLLIVCGRKYSFSWENEER